MMKLTAPAASIALLLTLPIAISIAQTPKKPANAPPKGLLQTRYGDITIDYAQRITGKGDLSGVRITGSRTLVTIPTKRSNSVLQIHADEIITKAAGSDTFAHADLIGNVRYTLTQSLAEGKTRVATGTADKAVFDHKNQTIDLNGSVHLTLNDEERLSGPGEIRAGHVVTTLAKTPTQYTLSGDAAVNDIRFTPREDAKAAAQKTKLGEIHIYHYTSGTFQIGQTAHFEGDDTTVDLAEKAQKSRAQIHASTFDADFTAAHSALKKMTANGDTRFHIERPTRNEKNREILNGKCDTLDYAAAQSRFTMNDSVEAELLAPDSMDGPARIKAARLVAIVTPPAPDAPKLADGSSPKPTYSYILKADAKNSLLTFTPIMHVSPPAKPGEKPPVPKFALGSVKITRFDYSEFNPGKDVLMKNSAGKVLFESDDAPTKTQTRIQARLVSAKLTKTNVVSNAEATGDVEFRVQEPMPAKPETGPNKARPAPAKAVLLVLEGTAPGVFFATDTDKDSRTVSLPGPFRLVITDPLHLAKPGTITGLTNDKLLLSLTGDTYDYDIQSDNQTARIDLQPAEKEKVEAKDGVKPASAPGKTTP